MTPSANFERHFAAGPAGEGVIGGAMH